LWFGLYEPTEQGSTRLWQGRRHLIFIIMQRGYSLALIVLSLHLTACTDSLLDILEDAPLADVPLRRTFARKTVNSFGCSLSFELPLPAAVVETGPITVSVKMALVLIHQEHGDQVCHPGG